MTPAEELRSAAKLMQERASAMDGEIGTGSYWRNIPGTYDQRYRAGVSGGLGGAAADLAAPFDPSTVRAIADLLVIQAVRYDCHLGDPTAYVATTVADRDPLLKVARAYLGVPGA